MANEELEVSDLLDALAYVEECVGALRVELARRVGAGDAEPPAGERMIAIPRPNRGKTCSPAYLLGEDEVLKLPSE